MSKLEMYNPSAIADASVREKMQRLISIDPATTSETETPYTLDESGMAELFADIYHTDCRYCPERKSWYTYADGRWVRDLEGLIVSAKMREFTRLIPFYATGLTDDNLKLWLKIAAKMGDRRFRDRILKDAKDNLKISAAEFDANPYLINCKNGTFDLQHRKLRKASYNDYITMQTNFEYRKEWKTCDRWEQFIAEVCCNDTEKAKFLQRSLGYSIVGTAKECMYILYGKTTRNGKSTLLDAIQHLLGDYSSVSPVSIICKSDRAKNAEAASPVTASLKGKRFVTMAESNQYGRLDEEQIKQLTGGEEILARNLYEAPFSYKPQFTMWLSCNDLPSVTDRSIFASDRIKVIEFTRHFTEAERDTGLKDEFQTPEAMCGIFMWMVKGYLEYTHKGLTPPDCVTSSVKQYEKENDLILQFLTQRTERVSDGGTRVKDLYDTYKLWCKNDGYYVCSAKKFTAGIREHTEFYQTEIVLHGYPFLQGISLN